MKQGNQAVFTNGSQTRYVYDANGVKQKRIHITAVDNIVVPLKTVMELSDDQILTSDTTEYLGNLVFENGRLDKVLFSSGYVSCNDNAANRFTFHYFVKDHLGNNRAVVNENGAIEQTTHYYPFGNSFADAGTSPSLQQYKYNGKELDRMHGLDWYDYGARNYDPVILQWDRPDPLADKYYPVSPYIYCMNNPVNYIDANGDSIYYDMPIIEHGVTKGYTRYTYGKYGDTYGFGRNGILYQGSHKTIGLLNDAINKISIGGENGRNLISYLSGSTSMDTRIQYGGEAMTKYSKSPKEILVSWSPVDELTGGIDENGKTTAPTYITLAHELFHAEDFVKNGNRKSKTWIVLPDTKKRISYKEYETCIKENLIRKENKLPLRKYYVKDSNGMPYEPSLILRK